MTITIESHPKVFAAFRNIDYDNGAVNRLEPERKQYTIPERFDALTIRSEAELADISDTDLDALCCGEEREQELLNPRYPYTDRLLTEYFESYGWGNGAV